MLSLSKSSSLTKLLIQHLFNVIREESHFTGLLPFCDGPHCHLALFGVTSFDAIMSPNIQGFLCLFSITSIFYLLFGKRGGD